MTDENIRVLVNAARKKRRRPLPSPNIMEAMQQMVGGYIEVIPLEEICLVRNERGKLMICPAARRLGK